MVLYSDSDVTPDELWRQLCASRLPRLWVPKREDIHVVDSIPMLGTGKVDLQGVKRLASELSERSAAV